MKAGSTHFPPARAISLNPCSSGCPSKSAVDAETVRMAAPQPAGRAAEPRRELDRQRLSGEIETALAAEDLGFDSLWTVEHHVSPYTMIPNPIGILQFLAGATKKVDLGTMVVVLPWHRPLRVAEDMVMLQYMMPGRRPFIGVGRGLGRREFTQMNYDMNETTGRSQRSRRSARTSPTTSRRRSRS